MHLLACVVYDSSPPPAGVLRAAEGTGDRGSSGRRGRGGGERGGETQEEEAQKGQPGQQEQEAGPQRAPTKQVQTPAPSTVLRLSSQSIRQRRGV